MKYYIRTGIKLAFVVSAIIGLPNHSTALTAAGDTISNIASMTYEVGGIPAEDPIESAPGGNNTPGSGNGTPTTLLVDSKVDLTMTAPANVTASGADEIMVFTITNEGNETQTYQLRLYSGVNVSDDDFDMENIRVYLDINKDGSYDAADGDLSYTYSISGGALGITPDVPGDVPSTPVDGNTIQVLVYADVPAGQSTNDRAEYTLKAESYDSTTFGGAETTASSTATNGANVLLADSDAGNGTNSSTDGNRNGDYLATSQFVVQAVSLTIQKGYSIVSDPINGTASPQPIPGAIIRYTIDITNSGPADADNVVITDDIPANTLVSTSEAVSTTSTLGAGTVTYDTTATGAGVYIAYAPADDSGAAEQTDSTVESIKVTYVTVPGTVSNGGADGTAQVTFAVRIQ